MRKALIATVVLFLMSCASSEPAPVPVIGMPEDLVTLTGEWAGTYESGATGRSGNITFHLTENPEGAHGDVLMVPKHELVYGVTESVLAATTTPVLTINRVDAVQTAGASVSVANAASAGFAERFGLRAEWITRDEARHSKLPVLYSRHSE